jgi:hypothetical protein
MFDVLGLAGAISSAITRLVELHRIDRWCKLVFTMLFSGGVSFLGTCGGALAAHRPMFEAVGTGMISAAVMMTVLFRKSDLTRGMIVALPESEARAEINTDIQVIEKK